MKQSKEVCMYCGSEGYWWYGDDEHGWICDDCAEGDMDWDEETEAEKA
ncbi:hypothetical protein [Alicyclobacillus macrosporangiidus]|uniref:Uncharacterized protein n=1 Tax=Alicyclobacillus macrosporangiidus TaxID=392015 RepID=A0A1I7ICJ3_9BACL|nr:hypothetical protein [Alicyclobacillus macrosporangiidus]SFU70672.1 hypothetical protein SAMN05421543_106135 [Alicyclobacillus macrosporangiidus]